MQLSRYVLPTTYEGQLVYFHTVTNEYLAQTTPESELERAGFLAGRDEIVVRSVLTQPPTNLALNVMTTWMCNLRCRHCSVADRLVTTETEELSVERLLAFCERYQNKYHPKVVRMLFCGGEPLLRPDLITAITAGARKIFSHITFQTTTNLTIELSPEVWTALAGLDHIGISVDGLERYHNMQRRPLELTGLANPFQRTIDNLKELLIAGYRNRVSVQAAVATTKYYRDFYRFFLKLGLSKDRIAYKIHHPSPAWPKPTDLFLKTLSTPTIFSGPCCKYRYLEQFVVDPTNKLYSDYYSFIELGPLELSFDQLEARAAAVIDDMPILNDDKCRNCSVVGYCWGGCSNCEKFCEGHFSNYCGQEQLIKTIQARAAQGTLVNGNSRSLTNVH